MGTREAQFPLNVLAKRCVDMNQDFHLCFGDYEKAFDKFQNGKLIEKLKRENIDSWDAKVISLLLK